jgi:hypothetical protein
MGARWDAASVQRLSNDEVVIVLLNTISHLSRWLSPIHDQQLLSRRVRRSEPSVKELLIRMRNEERRQYPKLYAIATQNNADLDRLLEWAPTEDDLRRDDDMLVLEIMAQCRRLRQSTTSLLRGLPDDSWKRSGFSRRERDWTIRQLGEHLVLHDQEVLTAIDGELNRLGIRASIARVSRASVDELRQLSPAPGR